MMSLPRDRHRLRADYSPPTSRLPSYANGFDAPNTLLVAGDNPMLLDLEAHMLRLEDYTVFEAETAAQALHLAADTATIDLFIFDLLMSEAAGLRLTRKFHALHPRTPVLMISSSLPVLRVRSEADLEQFEFLAKPFRFEELLRKVRMLVKHAAPHPARRHWCCD
jgi:DNA-binding NtrC family response regulator